MNQIKLFSNLWKCFGIQRAILMYFESIYQRLNLFLDLVLFFIHDPWIAEHQHSCKTWAKMSSIYLLLLCVIRQEKPLAPRAIDLGGAASIRIFALAVGNHRLFLAENAWTVANVALEDLLLHLFHAFWRFDIPLV